MKKPQAPSRYMVCRVCGFSYILKSGQKYPEVCWPCTNEFKYFLTKRGLPESSQMFDVWLIKVIERRIRKPLVHTLCGALQKDGGCPSYAKRQHGFLSNRYCPVHERENLATIHRADRICARLNDWEGERDIRWIITDQHKDCSGVIINRRTVKQWK